MTSTAPSPLGSRVRSFVTDRYLTVDLRTLGLFRIAFGLFLLGDLYERLLGATGAAFFTDAGIAPVHAIVTLAHNLRQWSPLFFVKTVGQLHVATAFIALAYAVYVVGWQTRWMKIVVAVIVVSLDQRNWMQENGGVIVMNIAAVATAFLPMGERFSIDALRRPPPARGTVMRLAYGLLVLDLAIIYLFTFARKSGSDWHDGSAMHYALWHARTANEVGFWLCAHEPAWFSPVVTRLTLYTEATLAVLIASPIAQRRLRQTAIMLMVGMHGTIAILMRIGPFSYVMMCLSLLLLGKEDWDEIEALLAPRFGERLARVRARLAAALGSRAESAAPPDDTDRGLTPLVFFREGATLLIAAASVCSLCFENPVPEPFHMKTRPGWAAAIVDTLRIAQQWNMFAPNAPHENTMLVIDGELANHEHVDPLTGKPPDFFPMLHPPDDQTAYWRNYLFRIFQDKYAKFRPYLGDYVLRVHTLPGAKVHEPIVRYDVYQVGFRTPLHPGGPPTNVGKKIILSGGESAPIESSAPSP